MSPLFTSFILFLMSMIGLFTAVAIMPSVYASWILLICAVAVIFACAFGEKYLKEKEDEDAIE